MTNRDTENFQKTFEERYKERPVEDKQALAVGASRATLARLQERKIEEEADYLRNLYDQNCVFRRRLFGFLVWLMAIETLVLFSLLVLQSLKVLSVDGVTLRILVPATLAQIAVMILVIVKSVFPRRIDDALASAISKKAGV
jgi:hypothetical protein